MSAEEYADRDIRSPLVSMPKFNMVSFTPAGRSLAVAEAASAVSDSEGNPLPRGEEALFAPNVEGLAVRIEANRNGARLTHVAFDGGNAHRLRLAFDVAEP